MSSNLKKGFRNLAIFCGSAALYGGLSLLPTSSFAQAPAATPATPSATPWTFQGLFDTYYLYDGNAPKGGGTGGTGEITGFEYAERASTPTLSLAELNIQKAAPATGGFGFKTTLIAGDTAGLNVPGGEENRYENIQQLYATYAFKCGSGIDLGKFYTPFGYEYVESNQNINYSRSWIFTDLLPGYHSGVRVYTPSYHGFVATGYLVKAINNIDLGSSKPEGVYDQNKSYGYIAQVAYTAPNGKLSAAESYGGSHDGPNGFQDKLLLSDTDITCTPNALDTYGFNYTNRQDSIQGLSSGDANGYALYYRRQLTTPYAVAFRVEQVNFKADGFSPRLDSLTATFEDKATKNVLLRLEFRHDDSKPLPAAAVAAIPSSDYVPAGLEGFVTGSGRTVSTQNTLSLSAVYTFGP